MQDHKKSFYKRITNTCQRLSPSDQRIVDYLLRDYPSSLLKTASEISRELGINASTVTRFFRKIGFKSIRNAQMEFKEDVDFLMSSPLARFQGRENRKSTENTLMKTAEYDSENITNTLSGISGKDLTKFFKLVVEIPSQVFVISDYTKTYALAYYLHIQLKSMIAEPIILVGDLQAIASSLSTLQAGDTLIAFSFRRYPKVHQKIVEVVKKRKGNLIAIVDSPVSPICRSADLTLQAETKSTTPFDSYSAAMSLINALLGELSKRMGKTFSDRYEQLESLYKDLNIF